MFERFCSAIILYKKIKSINFSDNIFNSQSLSHFNVALKRDMFHLQSLDLSCI